MLRPSLTAWLAALALPLFTACAPAPAPGPVAAADAPAGTRRAILASFDAMSERRMLETVDPAAVPAFRALFTAGACADGARPAFPSLTSPGHASLWTGTYGDVSDVSANSQPRLPRPANDLRDWISGYSFETLHAEPIWIAAARQGVTVYGHHPTQAPGVPGYPSVDGQADPRADSLRALAREALLSPRAHVINGYNAQVSEARLLTERNAPPRAARGWRNLDRLGVTVAPREVAWQVSEAGTDSLFALLYGTTRYTHVLVARTRDAAQGVTAAAAPVETAALPGRALARHFSPPLELPVAGGRVFARVRLFDVAPDAAHFALFVPELKVVEGNRPEVAAAYDAAVRGWYGNGALWMLERGVLGAPLWKGGDGTAERRYLETAELVTRQFMEGSAWAWRTVRPRLQLDYFPMVDEVDHALLGRVTPGVPGYDATLAARVQAVRERVWQMADMRMAGLRALVGEDPNAVLFVSGDHGMRATWRTFRPNVALAAAGLFTADSTGRPMLARTRALSTNGYYVVLNRRAWKHGIVAPAEEAALMAAAERALRAATGPDGQPIVTQVWRATDTDTLGLGGPTGGDLYYEVAPGYRLSADASGPVASAAEPLAGHGYPSTAPDMQTIFCATGAGVRPRRTAAARTIDAAPTVSEWLGITAPRDSRGISRLGELLGR